MAGALAVNASITHLDVRFNDISGEGASQLSAAVLSHTKMEVFNEIPVKEMRADSLTELNLYDKGIGVVGGMVVAGLLPVMASITHIGEGGLILHCNEIGDEGWAAIIGAVCSSTVSKVSSIDVSGEELRPKGAKLIGEALGTSVNASITEVCLIRESWWHHSVS